MESTFSAPVVGWVMALTGVMDGVASVGKNRLAPPCPTTARPVKYHVAPSG